jgi:hypothetical protein
VVGLWARVVPGPSEPLPTSFNIVIEVADIESPRTGAAAVFDVRNLSLLH